MELRSGTPYWPLRNGLMHIYPPLTQHLTADVLVIGAGITGALVGERLTREGLGVVMLDSREVGFGSTSVSTALLQYEIDTNLHELIQMIGRENAERAYRLCQEAIEDLHALMQTLPESSGFTRKASLYYASNRKDARMLQTEWAARRSAGFDVELLTGHELKQRFGINAPAALLSQVGGEVDPYHLAQQLLQEVQRRGGQVFDRTEVLDLQADGQGYLAQTARGYSVKASYVVVAMGYESARFLGKQLATLKNSYALVSEPIEGEPWPTGCLLWETARPYLYARTSADGRVLVGGLDDNHHNPAKRARALAAKTKKLEQQMHKLLPELPLETAFSWGGTFGETKDGLAFIGPKPGEQRLLFAMGYGGNGITYSAQAAKLLTDYIAGRPNTRDLHLFRLDR